MKNLYIVLFFLLAACGISGCYEDKGNYDYQNLTRIDIESTGTLGTVMIGDTVRLSPRFSYSSSDTVMNLRFEWTFAGKVIGTERNLVYVTDTIADSNCALLVEDLDHGVFFTQDYRLVVGYKYETQGFLVLGEKNGKSCLTFLKQTWNEALAFEAIPDVYGLENGGELGGVPMVVHEHFCADPETKGQVLVVQQGGMGLVDISGLTFKKEVTGNQMFLGGWPAGLNAADAMFMQWVDLITDDKGQLYSRIKSTNKLFHSEYFLPAPLKYEGETLEKIQLIISTFKDPKFCLVYDGKNNRYLAVMDYNDGSTANAAGMIHPVAASTPSEENAPLENMGEYRPVYIGYIRTGSMADQGYFAILEKAGKFYHQQFIVERNWSSPDVFVPELKQMEVPDFAQVVTDQSVIYALPYNLNGQYVFISKGKELYLYDRETPENGVKLFLTFDANVTAMNAEFFNSNYLGVGLENGKFFVLRMENAKNLQTDEEKIYWQSPLGLDFGKIKSVRYKVMGNNSWT